MNYRREIDGLRALAVVPVMLFHAGFRPFSGGFIGVDVFFVISGYLITSIILLDLRRNKFSLLHFYERRVRRILPALFFVMAVSSIFAYAWMLPDEFKNFGQSVFATTLFSNNILLAVTSNYWSLASEFKPLLHTWSLGVEEQYYIVFPFMLIVAWKYFRKHLVWALSITAILSFVAAGFGAFNKPDLAFYLLPTRAWEILMGALASFYLINKSTVQGSARRDQLLSALGLLFIVASVFVLGHGHTSPGAYIAVPTLGTTLIILFASERTIVGSILGSKVMVGLGLISYSAYLWHQPLFAFARVYSRDPPGVVIFTALFLLAFILAYITWRFIESPCRNRDKLRRNVLFSTAIFLSGIFLSVGYYLNSNYGVVSRLYGSTVATSVDLDKRFYNEKAFQLKKAGFAGERKLNLLIVGNSFGRDFVNMTTETFDLKNVDMVYRDDLYECIVPFKSEIARKLYGDADVIVFASGGANESCVRNDIAFAREQGKEIFYSGTKQFGYNLNWLMRIPRKDLPNQSNRLLKETLEQEMATSGLVPKDNYISILKSIVKDGYIPITDGEGRLISIDRSHLTRFGAIYIGERALSGCRYGEILKQSSAGPEMLRHRKMSQ